MKNLKKTLCLILALAFVLGLCTAAYADGRSYSDQSEIRYGTAVRTMSGLGILQGYDDDGDGVNEFHPKDKLTRAQAATIVAKLTLGVENAGSWPAHQVFTDVPADNWAAGAISYCVHAGIINGMGDGTFHPGDYVTQAAFVKMLLAAAGYGKKGEFLGEGWMDSVVALANQNRVQKGLERVEWSADATREETAQLAYNGLMSMVQVVLSENTNSYVSVSINGRTNVTFADSTWELKRAEGVVISNRTNDTAAQGTVLDGGPEPFYVTELDNDPAIIGHQVTIYYHLETSGSGSTAAAYFVDDLCTEVDGAEAAKRETADKVYTFSSGVLQSYSVPAAASRASSEGVYVLDGSGCLVSYKSVSYFIATLAAAPSGFTVYDPTRGATVSVSAPAGAGSGDAVTVYRSGDIYTAKAVTRKDNVAIVQSTRDRSTGRYSYNDGSIVFSKAAMPAAASIGAFTRLDAANLLEVGYSYTLYFDSEGGCIGFANKAVSSGAAAARDYALVTAIFQNRDLYGYPMYYAQIIRENGEHENVPISLETYTSGLPMGVYRYAVASGVYTFVRAGAEEAAYAAYAPADPLVQYDGAVFIWFNGSQGSLQVKTDQKPQEGSYVYYTYTRDMGEGTISVNKVGSVWFTVNDTGVVYVPNSFIYIADTASTSRAQLADGTVADFYEGYLNGERMNDLTTAAPPAKIGFAAYTKDTNGVYTLNYMADGNGTATGVRTFTMSAMDTACFLLNNKLHLKNALGNTPGMDLSGVKLVKVGAAEGSSLKLDSVQALRDAVVEGYKITMTIMEIVGEEKDELGDSIHRIGGSVIYITAVN